MKLVLEPMDVESGPLAVEGAELLIGRGIAGLLAIDEGFSMVSREHARLRREKGAWIVENLGKHGSFVNEEALKGPRALVDGDLLRFGRGGPRYRVRLREEAGDVEVRRCPACREIVPKEEVERHGRACPVLHPPSPSTFAFGPLRSAKKNLLILADLSGGPELAIVGPGLIDALQEPVIRFNVLAGAESLWPKLRAATDESRAEARAWLRAKGGSEPGGKRRLSEVLAKAAAVRDVEALVLLVSGEAEEVAERYPLEIHAIGLGASFYADSKAQAQLRDLAARHGGGFFALAARS